MFPAEIEAIVSKGSKALENGHNHLALACFEQAAALAQAPLIDSYLAYCRAIARREVDYALPVLEESVELEPRNQRHYLHLARVLLMAGDRERAIQTLRRGLQQGDSELLLRELESLGVRRPPIFGSLTRSHPLNKYLGKLCAMLGRR